MVDRFCPSCGTEVGEDARFCPTCGQTLHEEGGTARDELPAAPAWPDPPEGERGEPMQEPETNQAPDERSSEQPDRAPETAPHTAPQPRPAAMAAPPPGGAGPAQPAEPIELPFTAPTTLSGWLIGVGSVAGAIALIPRLASVLNVLLFLGLLGVAATIFLSDRMPDIPRRQLLVLLVVVIGLGVALERSAFTVRGLDTLFLICMLVAAGGVLLLELDRDRPMPPPGGPGG